MFAELAPIDTTLEIKQTSLSIVLENKFTHNHQVNLVVEDKQKQHAIFVTQSYNFTTITENRPINSVSLVKIVLGSDDNLSYKQMTFALPRKQVNTKVIWTSSEKDNSIHFYCFF